MIGIRLYFIVAIVFIISVSSSNKPTRSLVLRGTSLACSWKEANLSGIAIAIIVLFKQG